MKIPNVTYFKNIWLAQNLGLLNFFLFYLKYFFGSLETTKSVEYVRQSKKWTLIADWRKFNILKDHLWFYESAEKIQSDPRKFICLSLLIFPKNTSAIFPSLLIIDRVETSSRTENDFSAQTFLYKWIFGNAAHPLKRFQSF